MLRVEGMELLNGRMINLEVHPGEVLFIEGANGTGKSLLLKSLARLIPSKVKKFDFEINSIEKHRSKILYLPPQVSFGVDETVEEFVDSPFHLAIYKDFQKSFYPKTYLKELLPKKMNLLSSGQKQYVAILRAMSLDAQILLLDEPFGHIDQMKRPELIDGLIRWMGHDKSLIVISHDEIKFPNSRNYVLE